MPRKKTLLRSSALIMVGALTAISLNACNKNPTIAAAPGSSAAVDPNAAPALPLATGAATAAVAAPVAAALPPAPRAPIAQVGNPADAYAYVDQAYGMSNAIGQAPPDYGFDYQGVRPWVWRTATNAVRMVEPTEGGYRYYYYQPGAAEPYLVRDPQYSYGYSGGQLVAVYDSHGRILSPGQIAQRADWAGRYLARARALYHASLRSQRRAVVAANWAARRTEIGAAREEWAQQQNQYADWRAYHDQHAAGEQSYWRNEREHRERSAQAFNTWSDHGYEGPPPPPAYANQGRDERRSNDKAGVVGAIAGLLGGRQDHRGDRQGPPSAPPPEAAQGRGDSGGVGGQGGNRGPGNEPRQAQAQQQAQDAAITQARQQQAQAEAARRAQVQSQEQALVNARRQRAEADSAHQARAEAQVRAQQGALAQAKRQQAQADAREQQVQARAPADAARARVQQAQADAAARAQQARSADSARPKPDAAASNTARQNAAKQAVDEAHRRHDDGALNSAPQ